MLLLPVPLLDLEVLAVLADFPLLLLGVFADVGPGAGACAGVGAGVGAAVGVGALHAEHPLHTFVDHPHFVLHTCG